MTDVAGPPDLDPQASTESWSYFAHIAGKSEIWPPLIVKVHIHPVNSTTIGDRRAIELYAAKQPFFVAVEEHPVPTLASLATVAQIAAIEGAADIIADEPGTLGGFLENQHGARWGVSCGHVGQTIGRQVSMEDVGGTRYVNGGFVRHSNFSSLSPMKQSALCNQGCAQKVDACLIELDAQFGSSSSVKNCGPVDVIYDASKLGSGSSVEMNGARSGHNAYKIGAYGAAFEISSAATGYRYCFGHGFEIYSPGPNLPFVPAKFSQIAAPQPLRGDSGAWVCFNQSNGKYALFGTLAGMRGSTGLCLFADEMLNWAKNEGHDLHVF